MISAEIPDKNTDPQLYSIVTKHMIHGICGPVNHNAPCMKDGRCSKKYPYAFQEQTCTSEDGYPRYRRRSPSNGGHSFIIEQGRFHGAVIDNSRVVPYSPVLLRLFNCHINTEYCHSVKAIQYLCKYVYKGCDMMVFEITRLFPHVDANDGIAIYKLGRFC